jgi:hypothetical protein
MNALQGKTVGFDTAPLIYFIEENPARPLHNPLYMDRAWPILDYLARKLSIS